MTIATRRIGPVEIAVIDRTAALARIDHACTEKQPLMVAFCNAHTVNMARSRPDFAVALADALLLNDGIGVDIAGRALHGARFPDNLNGTDLTPLVLETASKPLRLFLLGSRSEDIGHAREALALRYPRHMIVGAHHGFFAEEEEAMLIERIVADKPDLLLIGMGHPRQELFAARHWRRIAGATMCIGAFLDFAAGKVTRAPRWMRAVRSEWLYRLMLEPRRLARRYLIGNFTFLFHVLHERISRSRT